jgi:hypothetical protein
VVDDVRAAVAWLRSRGVTVTVPPGLKTEDGIADVGFAWGVWIVDPAGNTMGIAQMKRSGGAIVWRTTARGHVTVRTDGGRRPQGAA